MRVGVFGALGRMGRTVCAAVAREPDLQLVAAVDPLAGGESVEGVVVCPGPQAVVEAGAEVAVDFTTPRAVMDNVRFCVANGIHCVVGTTGLGEGDLEEIERLVAASSANVVVAPNFSVGAVLAMRFAAQAARFFGSCEVVELHHDQKLDAPSGTALRTARGVAEAWRRYGRPGGEAAGGEQEMVAGARGASVEGVRVHAVRLRGLVAHQEVMFGGPGELLTIRHDSLDRSSFLPGVLMAVRAVPARRGLTVGLEHLLGL